MRVWLNNVPLSGVTEIDPQLRWVAIGACKLRGNVRVDMAPVQEMTVNAALQGLCV